MDFFRFAIRTTRQLIAVLCPTIGRLVRCHAVRRRFTNGHGSTGKVPIGTPTDPWPTTIEACVTRDWGQVIPGGYQAGFIVLRPSREIFEQVLQTIRTIEYVAGSSHENGWAGKGYGAFVGAAAMQGLMAYFYDEIRPGTSVELNQCRFNHMGMDVLYRAVPRHQKVGKCRNGLEFCEDCQITPTEQIYNIHYTQCRKPWTCAGQGVKDIGLNQGIPEDNVIVDHCLQLSRLWNEYRFDLEEQLFRLTGDVTIGNGGAPETLKRISELFDSDARAAAASSKSIPHGNNI